MVYLLRAVVCYREIHSVRRVLLSHTHTQFSLCDSVGVPRDMTGECFHSDAFLFAIDVGLLLVRNAVPPGSGSLLGLFKQ